MLCRVEVASRVASDGLIAAADMPAGAAKAQMHPFLADGEAFLAALGRRRYAADRVFVLASDHGSSLRTAFGMLFDTVEYPQPTIVA